MIKNSVIEEAKKQCIQWMDLTRDLKRYKLSIDDITIIYELKDDNGKPVWQCLQIGREDRMKVIVSLVKDKVQPTCMHIDSDLIRELEGYPIRKPLNIARLAV
ncbi:MAG: hypothetical protein ACLP2X_07330 [Syntrophobacteraceae bacterium]